MLLDVSRALRAPGEEFSFAALETIPDQDMMGDTVSFPSPAVATGYFSSAGDSIVVRGRISVTAQGSCARCLSSVKAELDIPFREVYARLEEGQTPDEADEFADSLYYTGSKVDLTGLVQSLVIIHLPMRFLCEPECPELGFGSSAPEPHPADEEAQTVRPFAHLDQLLKKDEEV